MAQLNAARRALEVRAGDGWEFAPTSPPGFVDPATGPADDPASDDLGDLPVGRWSLVRMFPVAVAFVALTVTILVFVVAVGYDWSVSP